VSHDLNALKNLFVLYRERSVTKAAHIMGVTQPSMSRVLNKLRNEYDDRLFVREKDTLVPTPKADLLVAKLAPLFEQIDQAMDGTLPMQPEVATGTFCFSAPDFISKFAMANLPSGILTITPKIEFSYRYWSPDNIEQIKSGDVDLAFGYLPDNPNHIKKYCLSEDEFVLLHRPGHPLKNPDCMDDVLNYPHISIHDSGFSDVFFDRALMSKGLHRKRVVTTPDIAAALSLLMRSDYLMVAPAGLARYLCPDAIQNNLTTRRKRVEYCLYWGAIKDQDKLHQYIRNIIQSSFQNQWSEIISK
jgi:DNA-binding transcriptional LysR family regulator